MTPEEVKKRFEKAIEAMFASASRQLGDIENKALDVIDSLHLMGSAMEGIAFDDGVIRSFSELLGKFKDAPMLINNVIKMSENFSDAWDAVSSAFRSAGSETEKTSSKVKDSAKSLDESKKAASGLKDKLDESSAAADAAKDKLAETADAAKNGLGEASGAADAAKNKLGETASAAETRCRDCPALPEHWVRDLLLRRQSLEWLLSGCLVWRLQPPMAALTFRPCATMP